MKKHGEYAKKLDGEKFSEFVNKEMQAVGKIVEEQRKNVKILREELKEKLGERGEKIKKSNEREKKLEKEDTISSSPDFRALIDRLHYVGDIKGSDGYVYNTKKLIEAINRVRTGELNINYVTRTLGLRKKVQELLEKQQNIE